jgi:alpha-amylase/alpha-mannosidase (GH57 family)
MVGGIKVAFRDTALSNLLGFTYKTMDPDGCRAGLRGPPGGPRGRRPGLPGRREPVEHYGDGGVAFRRALFRNSRSIPRIRTVTMSELPTSGSLDSIVAGSWINRNFGVWIGHPEDRKGWELLGRALPGPEGRLDNELAWECLRAAEGSDWYWWFGEDFTARRTPSSTRCSAAT